MITLHTNFEPVRRSLFLALGLLAACGDSSGGTSETGDTTNTPSSSSASTGVTGETGEPTTASSEPTGSASATGTDTGGTTVDATSDGTSEATTAGSTGGVSATTGSTGDGTTGAGTEETGDTVGPDCVQLLQNSDPPVPSGWVKCGDRLPHRVEQVQCEVPTSQKECTLEDQGCKTDADCTDKPFGSCHEFNNINFFGCGCVYGCETDADCAAGEVCRCGGSALGDFTTCTPSECSDDGDCPGEVCQFAQTYGEDCPFEVNDGHCSGPNDQCDSDFQCGTTGCLFDINAKWWECSNAICGRPFVVEAEVVTAPASGRDDWRALVSAPTVDPALAERLAAHWTQIGLYEHASVASFARFILQLLAVGAPASLVSEAQRALADEVEHARVCFALASLYKGTGVGPGALPQAGDAGVSGLADITAAVIREACVGETLSALEVREAAARAEDAGLRQTLTKIADDEQRHAELGWRFVQWATTRMDAAGRAQAEATFAAAIADAEALAQRMAGEAGAPELRAHGVVDAPLRAAVYLNGLRTIVAPSARALAA